MNLVTYEHHSPSVGTLTGQFTCTTEQWAELVAIIKEDGIDLSYCFGDDDVVDYTNVDELLQDYSLRELSTEQYTALVELEKTCEGYTGPLPIEYVVGRN